MIQLTIDVDKRNVELDFFEMLGFVNCDTVLSDFTMTFRVCYVVFVSVFSRRRNEPPLPGVSHGTKKYLKGSPSTSIILCSKEMLPKHHTYPALLAGFVRKAFGLFATVTTRRQKDADRLTGPLLPILLCP